MNRAVLNSTANSGPSVGASSLVTDANSALSGGPHLQRSASINTESYTRLPASPMSFSSNNISISGSSLMDGSSIVQQSSHQDQSSQHVQKRQQGASSASSQPTSRTSQVLVPVGSHGPNSINQEAHYFSQMQKKPRLEIKQEDIFQQQVMQQLFQRQDSVQLQGQNPQIQALIQQQRLLQQRQQQPQQILQAMPQMQRAQLQQQLQQQQLRQQVQQQSLQSVSGVKRPYENGICARRLMQYIYHQRHHPAENTIVYWKKFVTEYFAPRAKKRWCLSLYDNVGQHALGVFPQATMDAWQCDICGSKSGKGFEATFEVLPRLNKVKFDSGVIEEILYLDMPRECRFSSGILMLEYGKAIQESVFEQLRVIREGQLRIIFSPDLKILSWEFCARRHEEVLPRRLVEPQVHRLLQVAQKYQNAVSESGSAGVSTQELQSNWNSFLTAGRQLARSMELPLLNDLGFSKRYVRCLQISEVVNSMKDLIDFSREHNVGPIESLKIYPRQAAASKFQMQNVQENGQQVAGQGLSHDRSTMNRVISMHPGLGGHVNNNHMVGSGVLNTSAQTAVALSNYQNLLRQNSLNSNRNALQQEASGFFNGPNQVKSSPFQGHVSSVQGSMQNAAVNGLSSPHQLPQQQQPVNGSLILQHNPPQNSQGNQNVQQHMIQQLLHEMMNNSGAGRGQQQSTGGQSANGSRGEDTVNALSGTTNGGQVKAGTTGIVGSRVGTGYNGATNASGGIINGMRSTSYKSSANLNSMASGNDSFSMKSSDITQNLHLPELDDDITNEFPEWDV
ncbi:Transcriptional corepressor seuss-like protein [Thalictrum thalictroides]|uniref:Transcriptional corepressor seuss-like protein n=1 Tax=Thalictrum thalictroides TaxID=46969 RepID=A0A7J6UV68_THATH|nr:Transcriptional corepressor seuss-like protein [Thalictrum thalictroides]